MRLFRALATLLLPALIWPAAAQAQYWATRAVCDVDKAKIVDEVLSPADLATLRARAALTENPVGRFWRVASPDGAVSHLWGTNHSNNPLILDLPRIVMDRISKARVVAVEIDFTFPSRRRFEMQFEYSNTYRSPRQSFDFDRSGLDPRVIGWIRSRAHGVGWTREAPDFLKPGALAELLLPDPCDDFSSAVLPSQDNRIQMLGQIAGAEILGMEPADSFRTHLNLPQNHDLAQAILSVYGAYLEPTTSSAGRATSFALYKAGEIGVMQAWNHNFLSQFFGETEAERLITLSDGYLLAERNHRFLDAALEDLEAGGVFMAVGAFHLPGDQGMIELLRKAGFTVTRIPLPEEVRE